MNNSFIIFKTVVMNMSIYTYFRTGKYFVLFYIFIIHDCARFKRIELFLCVNYVLFLLLFKMLLLFRFSSFDFNFGKFG